MYVLLIIEITAVVRTSYTF